ncbi:tyrosine protein kinase ITK/TSK, putative [Entamoeba invadens IP1]|uniref:Tyrosine protein kinase ITK/TSK, putative n=2 Tax=Entamoeba invadens TaxID=33085 RepID=A0A0A1U6Z6_ENTIV|nr:tyrosine protein kinase ITK/TSK, putative [Entamoeba invadens IP1]ELP90162.1 tyrosine protein kinase ITK/TSK, putative [Entamoeba invadens IP1]BAN41152.1 tyrosine protein kinase ITK/TSK, putative [Entamoeba invadens]BAN42518.1 tyrosine protein kinase ITK/TSK, putative [Entamoeba invadens]|eukprot:XP_004256933.1 tyrosine protein kinase ITK/TSK, putative [Entamoeba invadens IP1]
MSSKGLPLSSSISTYFDEGFALSLEPKIEKLTFGSNYAIQGIPLVETIGFVNKTDCTYKLNVETAESPKYELTVDNNKFTLKKGDHITIKVTLLFHQYATMGLTGQVQFHLKKKALMGGEIVSRALRFQLEGIVPAYNDKDLVKASDEEQFRVGMINGVLSTVKNESVVAFKYNIEDKYEKDDYEFIQNVYRDIHHPDILGMTGIILASSTILLDGDTVSDLQTLMEKEKMGIPFLLRCCSDCANALMYLSSHNIIHRNVKPSKLRVVHHDITNEGKCTVKLHDLTTIFKLRKGEVLKKSPGTYQYMAPEVMEMREHGLPIDVYSFGMTMIHIFTNEVPYKDLSNAQIQQKVCAGERPAINPTQFPNGMPELIQLCLKDVPTERPSFSTIVAKLNDIIKDYSQ